MNLLGGLLETDPLCAGRKWQHNNSGLLFNDNNQHYSVILQNTFRHTSGGLTEPKIIQQRRNSMHTHLKQRTYLHELLYFSGYIRSLSETQSCESALTSQKYPALHLFPAVSLQYINYLLFLMPKGDYEHYGSLSFCQLQ